MDHVPSLKVRAARCRLRLNSSWHAIMKASFASTTHTSRLSAITRNDGGAPARLHLPRDLPRQQRGGVGARRHACGSRRKLSRPWQRRPTGGAQLNRITGKLEWFDVGPHLARGLDLSTPVLGVNHAGPRIQRMPLTIVNAPRTDRMRWHCPTRTSGARSRRKPAQVICSTSVGLRTVFAV